MPAGPAPGMLEKLRKSFEDSIINLTASPRIITMSEHSSWGNSIFWTDYDQRKLSGFMQQKPTVGDIVRANMQSGKVARFRVESVENIQDPKDMFFAKVSDLGYE